MFVFRKNKKFSWSDLFLFFDIGLKCAPGSSKLCMLLLPSWELTAFKEQVCSTKIGYANALSLWTNSCKKGNIATLNSAHQAKKQYNVDSGSFQQHQDI